MAADQQFCLRWNNHQSTLVSVFDSLLEKETLVDCTLAAEGQYLKAHKVVLCACSPYLETLLSQHYEKHPIVILKDVKFTELKSMMDYMYRGEVNISQDQLGTFLKAAESLQIKGLSENGEGDARDVGSTTKPPPRKPPATPAAQPEPAQSPAHRSRDGSVSPSSRKRRRLRRNSDDGDNHLDSNSCDLPVQAQSTPVVPNIPASITTTPIRTPIVKPEVNDRLDHNSLPPESGLLKEKIEPAEPLLEPKTEYLEDLNNDDSVEDLTLDDDDEMDMSQMSNMSNMSRPGPSHGADISNQGFTPWQLGNQSGTDEVFMAAQEAVNAHRDSQDPLLCPYCGLDFKRFDRLVAHVHQVPGNANKLNCFLCDRLAVDEPDLVEHLQTAHIKIESSECFACEHCQRFFFTREDLTCHAQNWCRNPTKALMNALDITGYPGPSKVYRCMLCPFRDQNEEGLLQHMMTVHSLHFTSSSSGKHKTKYCGQCGQVFTCLEEIIGHKERCDLEFQHLPTDQNPPLKNNLNKNEIQPELLSSSNEKSPEKKSVSEKKTPAKPKPKCAKCQSEFKTKNTLNVHERSCFKGISL